MSIEAMKLALEALNNSVDLVVEDAYNAEKLYGNYPTRQGKVGGLKVLAENHKEAIKALEEALVADLSAPKQEQGEPVAWKATWGGETKVFLFSKPSERDFDEITPLYAMPKKRNPLTDEQIADIVIEMNGNEPPALFWKDLTRAIEAAHGIKE